MLSRWLLTILTVLVTGCGPGTMSGSRGTSADVRRHLQRLVNAQDQRAFLIISVEGTPHFLQFSANTSGIEMDFPLVTSEQRDREARFRELCSAESLPLRETRGSDGTPFLDCDLPRDAAQASEIVRRALEGLFGVSDSASLRFEGDHLPPVAA